MDNKNRVLFILVLFVLLTILNACKDDESSGNGYLIYSEIEGIKEGKAYLAKLDLVTNEKTVVDSAAVENGTFTFQGELKSPYIHSIFIEGSSTPIHLFLENSHINIAGNLNDLENIDVSGSREDSLFRSYTTESLFEREAGMEIMLNHPSYTFSAFVAYYQFQIHNIQVDTMDIIIDNFSDDVKQSIYYDHLFELYNTIKRVAISQPAPDFRLPDNNGDTIQLSDFRGKYVLIDFWASWCAPCRAANPALLKAYEALRDKGFTIVGISVDKKKTKWLEAIEKDGLTWTNLSSLKGWDEVSNTYGVKAVPQNFMIDPDGIIIEKNIEIESLAEQMEIILSQK